MGLRISIHLLSGDNEWLHFRKHRNLSDPYAPITALYCQGLFSEEAGSPLLDELHQTKPQAHLTTGSSTASRATLRI